MSAKKDMTGLRCGLLVVLSEDGSTKGGKAKWKCRCECGNIVSVTGDSLRNKHQKSCGCQTSIAVKALEIVRHYSAQLRTLLQKSRPISV